MKKLFIKNRNNKKISVIIEQNHKQKGLVFVMHGLGGFKEQKHIQTFAKACLKRGLTVVRFDARDTIGESEGVIERATTTSYYKDLEDIIKWAEIQKFYQEPFYLIGHSLGGICTALYAQKHPKKIKALAPLSTVVSGKFSLRNKVLKKETEKWKKTGWLIKESNSKPGVIKKIKWTCMLDQQKYDLLKNVRKLAMPILMIVGSKDKATPLVHQRILFDKLPGKKELHIIKGAQHTFRESKHLIEIKKLIEKWVDRVEKNKK